MKADLLSKSKEPQNIVQYLDTEFLHLGNQLDDYDAYFVIDPEKKAQ